MFYQITRRPFVIGGFALGMGYARSFLHRKETQVSPDLMVFVRREQVQRLRNFLTRTQLQVS